MSNIQATTNIPPAPQSTGSTSRTPAKTLSQTDFLKILTIQLTKQDPLKPIEDQAFIGQMAQFSTLQQTSEMAKSLAALKNTHELAAASGLIGKFVTIQIDPSSTIEGKVAGVDTREGMPMLSVSGKLYEVSSIKQIKDAALS